MFSREEAKQVRQDFWTMFGKRYDRKWILYNTGIKDFNFKFSFEDRRAMVSIDLVHEDSFYQEYYFEKLESFKSLMQNEISQDLIFDPNYVLPSGKEIARIYLDLEGVKITKKTDWPQVYEFFFTYMDRFEKFYQEYREFIQE
ncbi:MAG: DUF4268 domain-containing protein [Nonlabens sp.]